MKRKLLILTGAGASYSARTPSPPLGTGLLEHLIFTFYRLKRDQRSIYFLNQGEEGYPAVESLLNMGKREKLTYEQLNSRIIETNQGAVIGDPGFEGLTMLLAVSMLPCELMKETWKDVFPFFDASDKEGRDKYDDFLLSLTNKYKINEIVFVTLNYDILLEQAIERQFGIPSFERLYGWDDAKIGECLLLKIHGSCNWVGRAPIMPEELSNGPIPLIGNVTGHAIDWADKKIFWYKGKVGTEDIECIHNEENNIILAQYAPGKPCYTNPSKIEEIRELALQKIAECEEALIIGVHPEKEKGLDPTLSKILGNLRKIKDNVTYVGKTGPDTEYIKNTYGFNLYEDGFQSFIEKM